MVFAGLFPSDTDEYPSLRDALARLKLNDARPLVRARDVAGARFRLPLRVPRPASPRHRAGAARAGVRPRSARHGAERRLPRDDEGSGEEIEVHNPSEMPRRSARGRRAVHPGLDHPAEGVRRRRHGAESGAPGRFPPHGVPERGPRARRVRPPARRGRLRLLRPAQVADARLRELRLRPRRASAPASSSGSTSC